MTAVQVDGRRRQRDGSDRIRVDTRIVVDLHGNRRFVARIVARKDRNIAVCIVDGGADICCLRERGACGRPFRILGYTVQREDRNVRKVVVVRCADRQVAAGERRRFDRRRDVVDRKVIADKRAAAEPVAFKQFRKFRVRQLTGSRVGYIRVYLNGIILRNGVVTDAQNVAVLNAEPGDRRVCGIGTGFLIVPSGSVDIIPDAVKVCFIDGNRFHAVCNDVAADAVQFGNGKTGCACRTDQVIGKAVDHRPAADRKTRGREARFRFVRVAGELQGLAVDGHRHVVRVRIARIGRSSGAVYGVDVGGGVKHRRFGPAAVEAEDRDRVLVRVTACAAGHIREALDISAVRVVGKLRLRRACQRHGHGDQSGFACGNGICVLRCGLPVQKQMRIL